jgi:hypothetical protein
LFVFFFFFLKIPILSISSVGRRGCVGRIGADAAAFGVRRFVLLVEFLDGLDLLFELHASVLKPNFDLALCQAQGVGHFDPPPPRQVVICVELFLQFQRLVARVRLTASTPQSVGTLKLGQTQNNTVRCMFVSLLIL